MITTWKPNPTAPLWHSDNKSKFFQDLVIKHTKQIGPSCVATTLSMLVNSMGYETSVEVSYPILCLLYTSDAADDL